MTKRRPSLSPSRSLRPVPSRSSQTYVPPPRHEQPTYPPEPPLTLIHPTTSRSVYPDVFAEEEQDTTPPTPAGDYGDGRTGDSDDLKHPRQAGRSLWYRKWMPFAGMVNDIRCRAPWYLSDWMDAYNYRVVPATWFIFFANVLPGLAFSLELIENTHLYGAQEVLLSSFMAAFVASVFGGQPLLISGVTGPISVFNNTIFKIFKNRDGSDGYDYLHFMGWVYLWAAIMHWIAAAMNAVIFLKWVTRFSCDTFGFYVAFVYLQYGIQVVTHQFQQSSTPAAFLGIIVAILTLVIPHYFNALARSGYINKHFRRFCADYGMPLTVIAATGFAYWGRFNPYVNEKDMTFPTVAQSFSTAAGRDWLVRFWHLPAKYVGIAFPFGLILFILFYFDANVSALIAQSSEYPLVKPAAFHWDFFLLGVTTFIAGLLGIPAPNGLIPQAPLHTASLVVMGHEQDRHNGNGATSSNDAGDAIELSHTRDSEANKSPRGRSLSIVNNLRRRPSAVVHDNDHQSTASSVHTTLADVPEAPSTARADDPREVPVAVVEQRVSNLAQGCLSLVLMTKPFEHVLGLIPKGVLAGLFWFMGSDALLGSGVTQKILYLLRDARSQSPNDPLHRVRKSRIALFTLVELIGFGATFAITQTIAAIGFPVVILLLVPVRMFVVPHLGFTSEELEVLDGPVASPFTMESVMIKPPRKRAPSLSGRLP